MASKVRDWDEIRSKMTPEARARSKEKAAALLAEMPLHELRRARQFTQNTLAAAMGDQQSSVSRLEQQTDMYVSTLRSYIEAMGGELEVVARFPDGAVKITQFQEP